MQIHSLKARLQLFLMCKNKKYTNFHGGFPLIFFVESVAYFTFLPRLKTNKKIKWWIWLQYLRLLSVAVSWQYVATQGSKIYIFPPAHLRIVSCRGTDDGMDFRINNVEGPSIYTTLVFQFLILSDFNWCPCTCWPLSSLSPACFETRWSLVARSGLCEQISFFVCP